MSRGLTDAAVRDYIDLLDANQSEVESDGDDSDENEELFIETELGSKGNYENVPNDEDDDDIADVAGTVLAIGLESEENAVINEDLLLELIDSDHTPDENHNPNIKVTAKGDIKWSRRPYDNEPFPFVPTHEEEEVGIVLHPAEYFMQFFNSDLFDKMAFYTNLYAVQKETKNFQQCSIEELKVFIGLQIIIGCIRLRRVSMCWDPTLKIGVFSFMTLHRFRQLRTSFHVMNNLEIPNNCADKFVKVRPIIEAVRARCNKQNVEENICVDEQIIPFKGRLSCKVYHKGKPNPWGIKNYVLCGKSGFPYDFIMYQGKGTQINSEYQRKYGFSAAVVLHLVDKLRNKRHKVYFDNFFNSYHLLEVLTQMNINAAGTVRINRFGTTKLLSDKELQKKGRGAADCMVDSSGKIALIKWQDNRATHFASNFVAKGTEDIVTRFDKKSKTLTDTTRPEIVRHYNSCMGGVDLLDQLISYYRIFIKSTKWTLRLVTHFIDFALSASWILYKIDCQKEGMKQKDILDLLNFRMKVANYLIYRSQNLPRKRGRPSAFASPPPSPPMPSTSKCELRPLDEIRTDKFNHMPTHDRKKLPTRCKYPKCKAKTYFMCTKCGVHLCISRENNCFQSFHD